MPLLLLITVLVITVGLGEAVTTPILHLFSWLHPPGWLVLVVVGGLFSWCIGK